MQLSIYRYAKELTTSTERFSRSRPYAENPFISWAPFGGRMLG